MLVKLIFEGGRDAAVNAFASAVGKGEVAVLLVDSEQAVTSDEADALPRCHNESSKTMRVSKTFRSSSAAGPIRPRAEAGAHIDGSRTDPSLQFTITSLPSCGAEGSKMNRLTGNSRRAPGISEGNA
jgi:hypothetical protein